MKTLLITLLLSISIFGQTGGSRKSVLTQAQKDSIGAMISDSLENYNAADHIVYVSNYGGVDNFNGVTNDSSVFTNAWDDVPDGGTLIINKMLYVGSSGWQGFLFQNKKSITIKGESGGGFSLLYRPTQLSGTWWSHQASLLRFEKCDNIVIDGIHINGKGISAGAIEMDSCRYYQIVNSHFDSLGNFVEAEGAVNVILTLGGYRGLIDNNLIEEAPHSGIGIMVTTPTEESIIISNNKIYKCAQDAIFVTGAHGGGAFNNIISDAGLILASSDHATQGSLIDGFQVIGNTIKDTRGSGIKTDGSNSWSQSRNNVEIANNTFINDSTIAINVTYINGWNIHNNLIINTGGGTLNIGEKRSGIAYSSAINTTISDNLIIDNRETKQMEIGIYVAPYDTDMTNNKINFNTIIGASEYGILVTKGETPPLDTFVSENNWMQGNYVEACSVGIKLKEGMLFRFDDNIMVNNTLDLTLDTVQTGINNVYTTKTFNNGSYLKQMYEDSLSSNEIKSRNYPIATEGFIKMGSSDSLLWRNNANNGNVSISKDTADKILIGGLEGIQVDNIGITNLPTDSTGLRGGSIYAKIPEGTMHYAIPKNLVTNGSLNSWTGVGKLANPTGWTRTGGSALDTADSYIEQSPTGQLHFVYTATTDSLLIIAPDNAEADSGVTYGYSYEVKSITGLVTIRICGVAVNVEGILSVGVYSGEVTPTADAPGAGIFAFTDTSSCDLIIDNFRVWRKTDGLQEAPIFPYQSPLNLLNPTINDTIFVGRFETLGYMDSIRVFDIIDSIAIQLFYRIDGDGDYNLITAPDTLTTASTIVFDVTDIPVNARVYMYPIFIGDTEAYIRSEIYWRKQ